MELDLQSRPGQISTKHLKTSIRPFFATCRLPQYPEFWRCVETGKLFLGPHCKRSLKSLENLLTVTTPNTQLLPRPRKMVAVVLNIFFWEVDKFFIFWCALSPPPSLLTVGNEEILSTSKAPPFPAPPQAETVFVNV
jgi:hypothetical protein